MNQHRPISPYHRFLLAEAIVDAVDTELQFAIDNFRLELGLDRADYDDGRICLIAENIVALG